MGKEVKAKTWQVRRGRAQQERDGATIFGTAGGWSIQGRVASGPWTGSSEGGVQCRKQVKKAKTREDRAEAAATEWTTRSGLRQKERPEKGVWRRGGKTPKG